ncbi:hypothetical protein CMV_018393 [Castanea mollissima]|uniref:Oligopeptide transporter n=1 Tax=Castanea mollissima TaxID=60419 RepID=A0A8J4R3F8_9ROSI|nr:hypothetical protein CMV_018393 [Castanea mollissima]
MLTSFSWICWIFPTSVLAQQLGSGLHGLGIGALGFDWSSVSAYLGSSLASPWFATTNVVVGFALFMYVITPIAYWLNIYEAKTFPTFPDGLFTSTGQKYNVSAIIDPTSALTMSEIWQLSKSALQEKKTDVHTKLMRKYKQVPQWWFMCLLVVNIVATIFACRYYIDQLQLPWWSILLACSLALFFTLPVGVITATTNQGRGSSPAVAVQEKQGLGLSPAVARGWVSTGGESKGGSVTAGSPSPFSPWRR